MAARESKCWLWFPIFIIGWAVYVPAIAHPFHSSKTQQVVFVGLLIYTSLITVFFLWLLFVRVFWKKVKARRFEKSSNTGIIEVSIDSAPLEVKQIAALNGVTASAPGANSEASPGTRAISGHDKDFLFRLHQIIDQHIDQPGFSVEDICRLMAISHSALHRKMIALTGDCILHYIQQVRLIRASQLLQNRDLSVTEVAYLSGFSDLSYFGKVFRKKFGTSPKSFRNIENGKFFPIPG